MSKKSYLHCSNILESKTSQTTTTKKHPGNRQRPKTPHCGHQLYSQSPYLRFNVSKFARLLGRLGEKVRAHFQHGRRVVVHSALLQLSHLGLHALLDVVLDLRNTARGRGGLTGMMRKQKKKRLNRCTAPCSAKFSWRASCDCTPCINIKKPAHSQLWPTSLLLPEIIDEEIFSAKWNNMDALKHNMPNGF